MEVFLTYTLKSAGLLTIFYLGYLLLLRQDLNFQAIRIFLKGGIIASFLLPAIYFTRKVVVEESPLQRHEFLSFQNKETTETLFPILRTWEILGTVYLLVTIVLLFRMGLQLWSIIKLIKNNRSEKKQKIKYIQTSSFISPFSFYNYIVYDPLAHSEKDLELILQHEKIHASQHHSTDILIANVAITLLWFNPLTWFYKKSMEQNLEFIADRETVAISGKKKSYQKTLLKISMANLQPALTNPFYQSFTKKRILMLNKKTTGNFAISKISLILPAILAFMLCFNVKSEAQSITSPLEESKETDVFEIMIYNTASEEDLREFKNLAKNKNILLQFEDVKRNKEGKISTIQTTFQDLKSNKTGSLNQSNSEGVAVLVFSRNSDGSISMFSLTKKKNTKLVSKNSQENKEIPRNPLYILNGKKSQKEIIDLIDTDLIERINVLKGKNAVSLYGEEAKDGAVVITTKILDSKKQSSETMKEIIIYPNARKKYNSDNPYSYKATKEDGPIMVVDGEKTEPMVIIDGEKSNRSAFKEINPENIEKITVLKGQKAMQKYGKEAYQGAIEITSKNDKK